MKQTRQLPRPVGARRRDRLLEWERPANRLDVRRPCDASAEGRPARTRPRHSLDDADARRNGATRRSRDKSAWASAALTRSGRARRPDDPRLSKGGSQNVGDREARLRQVLVIDWEGGERADGPWINLGGAPPEHPGTAAARCSTRKTRWSAGACVHSRRAQHDAGAHTRDKGRRGDCDRAAAGGVAPAAAGGGADRRARRGRSWRQLVELEDVAAVLEDPELRGDELRKRLTGGVPNRIE